MKTKLKIKIPKYTLEDMVKGITKKNRHQSLWPNDKARGREFDWGKPMGKEVC